MSVDGTDGGQATGDVLARTDLPTDELLDLAASAAEATLVVEDDGTVRYANGAAAELLGRDADELLERPFGCPVTADGPARVNLVRPDRADLEAELDARPIHFDGRRAHVVVLQEAGVGGDLREDLARVRLHVRGLSLRLTRIEERLEAVEARLPPRGG